MLSSLVVGELVFFFDAPLKLDGLIVGIRTTQVGLFPPTFLFNQSLPLFTGILIMFLVALFTLFAIPSNIFVQG